VIFWPQLIALFTEPPGNIVYYLVTLFALQVVFVISLSQWLRDKRNADAWRHLAAAGTLIAGRVLLLAMALLLAGDVNRATSYLLPLEQALTSISAVMLVWALVPPSVQQPRLGSVLLLLALFILTLLAIAFTIAWQPLAAAGAVYAETSQVQVWLMLQAGTYGLGLALTLVHRHTRTGLSPFILGVALATAVAALLTSLGPNPSGTQLLFWLRLGYLVALPLWAVLVYRQSITPLLATQQANRPAVRQLTDVLNLSAAVLQTMDTENRAHQAVTLIEQMVDAAFVGVGIFPPDSHQVIHLTSNLPQVGNNTPKSWQLDLVEWPPFRAAIRKKESVELLPDGTGMRPLQVLYAAIEVGPLGAMLVEPMFIAEEPVGMLLLAKPDGRLRWTDREKAITPALAAFVAQAVVNTYAHQPTAQLISPPATTLPIGETAVSGRLIALEAERDRLAAELDTTANRAAQAESRAVVALQRAHDLAHLLEEMERASRDERINALEQEIETLRESLVEAEDAMAIAAAGESELSTEWIMLTITRYSGQLEEAQARIVALETELEQREQGTSEELLVALIQELRTPMTSIGGFTDLLLGETLGILGTRQRDLLQRVQANTKRMGSLLDQMLQLVSGREQPTPTYEEVVDVQDVIETAVTGVLSQVREKNLRLDLHIPPMLPPLTIRRRDLHQMLTHLLHNACQASGNNGRVMITAQAAAIHPPTHANEWLRFLQVNVSDSGSGIHPDDLAAVFATHHRADAPLIRGLGETGAGLAVARNLAQANGGRVWVESTVGVGSIFSLLFPLPGPDEIIVNGDTAAPANGTVRP
jgi:signal transduction histidine kinase